MRFLTAAAWIACSLVCLDKGAAEAGDDPSANAEAMSEARDAYAAYQDHVAKPRPIDDEARVAVDRERLKLGWAFADAFGRTEFDAWSLPADTDLFQMGASWFASRSEEFRRWEDARRALDAQVRRLPGASVDVRRRGIPDLLTASGDLEGALARLTAVRAEPRLGPAARVANELRIGDLLSALGDVKSAKAAFQTANETFDGWNRQHDRVDSPFSGDDSRFLDERSFRLRALGRSTVGIRTGSWIGAPTVDWFHLAGRIVFVHLCRTADLWSEPIMSELDRFASANAGLPLQILVVVHPAGLPGFKRSAGRSVRDHVVKLRTERKLSIPFAVLEESEFDDLACVANSDGFFVADSKRIIVAAGTGQLVSFRTLLGIAEALAKKVPAPDPATPPK
jgi:hypothetical protein